MKSAKYLISLAAALLLAVGVAHANSSYEAGKAAYEAQNYSAAFSHFFTAANEDNHQQSQLEVGRLLVAGRGIASDLTQGYKWLTIAYLRGMSELSDELAEVRRDMAESQVVEAERLAIEWVVGEAEDPFDIYQAPF